MLIFDSSVIGGMLKLQSISLSVVKEGKGNIVLKQSADLIKNPVNSCVV